MAYNPIKNLKHYAHRAKSGTNTGPQKTVVKRGTGKGQSNSPTHKTGGAISSPAKSKGPLDSRWRGGSAARVAKSITKRGGY